MSIAKKIHISAGALVIRPSASGHEALLLYRKATDSWHLPKGTCVGRESILETALREVKEETGFDIIMKRCLGRLISLKQDGAPKLTYYYLAHPADLSASAHDAVRFCTCKKAYQLLKQKSLFEKEYQLLEWMQCYHQAVPCKPLIIFDLDHTIFDTARFKLDMFSSLQKFNIPQREVSRAYKELMVKQGEFLYDYRLDDHLKLLRRTYSFALEEGRKRFLKIFSKSHRYLFPGVTSLLRQLQTRGCELVLLTRGNKQFNLRKVRDSGLNRYFDQVIADYKDKVSSLGRILKKHGTAETWFIGDSVEELAEASRLYPGVNCVLKLRNDKDQPGRENFVQIREMGDLRKLLI